MFPLTGQDRAEHLVHCDSADGFVLSEYLRPGTVGAFSDSCHCLGLYKEPARLGCEHSSGLLLGASVLYL
jgi:hypothetical protein